MNKFSKQSQDKDKGEMNMAGGRTFLDKVNIVVLNKGLKLKAGLYSRGMKYFLQKVLKITQNFPLKPVTRYDNNLIVVTLIKKLIPCL